MAISTLENIGVLRESINRISAEITDNGGTEIDPARLILTVTDLGGTVKLQDMWPAPANRIIQSSTGNFYVDYGPPIALLDGPHGIGLTTLTIKDATPQETKGWPLTGTIFLDHGLPGLSESAIYTSISVTGGVGTMTLQSPLQIAHGDNSISFGPSRETSDLQELLFNWQIQIDNGDQVVSSLQKIKVISQREASLLGDLRLMIDKSKKLITPNTNCFLGYSDTQLLSYLEGGLQNINAYQPSLVLSMENYPMEFKQVLLDSALITGVMSQQLYAIDTDIPNYNDQGTAFVITHQSQLASFLNQVTQRLDRLIPMMKLQLITPGSLHIQMGPSFRLQTLMAAAPQGSIFRGVFFKG